MCDGVVVVGWGELRIEESPLVRAALGRPSGAPPKTPANAERVAAALRGLPSHGWTAGMFGRRDRALLVLSQVAGLPHKWVHGRRLPTRIGDAQARVVITADGQFLRGQWQSR